MAFLFKSKKNQDRALASRDGPPSSASSIQSAAARVREEKASRSTPTGSLNSVDNDGSVGSPDQGYARQRGLSLEQAQHSPQSQQHSDLPVSFPFLPSLCLRVAMIESRLTWRAHSFAMAAPPYNRNLPTPTLRSTRGPRGG